MAGFKPTPDEEKHIDGLVAYYEAEQGPIKRLLNSLHQFISESESLNKFVHSVKKRMKDPTHLKDKLIRELEKAQNNGVAFNITKENLFTEINDLGGYRILHLHTRQMADIHRELLRVFEEAQCTVIKGPDANVWDRETEEYFKKIDIHTKYNPRLYSSVHYIVQPNSKVKVTIEVQVRSLSEEVWGEVDHKFNYPHPIDSVACGEQIKVLARVASSCSRLVDSIFASYADHQERIDGVAFKTETGPDEARADAKAQAVAKEPAPKETETAEASRGEVLKGNEE
jgi:putative GTP pyrophosphokinase